MSSQVTSVLRPSGVQVITLERPEKRNALSKVLVLEFLDRLALASQDPDVKVIVITGKGSFFCAGADLNDIAALDASTARSCRYLEDLCHGMAAVRKPLIAAVNGPALGGGFEIALMCDIIIASNSAYFALPEIQRGLIPGAGGTQRLTAAVGKFRAMRTIIMGRPILSQEALTWGLASEVFNDDTLLEDTLHLAAGLAQSPGGAVSTAKEAICRADRLCRDDEFERNLYYHTFGTAEKREGVNDFLQAKTLKKFAGARD